jgi:hypothetical protein
LGAVLRKIKAFNLPTGLYFDGCFSVMGSYRNGRKVAFQLGQRPFFY